MKKLFYLFTIALVATYTGCIEKKNCNCTLDDQIILENDSLIQESMDWEVWNSLGIPHLKNQEAEVYRLLISPSWISQEKTLYTLKKGSSSHLLIVNYFNKNIDGTITDSLNRNEVYNISVEEWENFGELIRTKCFWTMPSEVEQQILDGTMWIFEGKKHIPNDCTNREFHLIGRKEGYNSKDFFEICGELITLAKKE